MVEGFTLAIDKRKLTEESRKYARSKVRIALEMIKAQVQRNISLSSSQGRSLPGEFPRLDTGNLRNSIYTRMIDDTHGVIGTTSAYGMILEYGTHAPHTIYPKNPGGVLSWLGQDGVRRFAKYVTIPALAPRPFLRRTMQQMKPEVKAMLAGYRIRVNYGAAA